MKKNSEISCSIVLPSVNKRIPPKTCDIVVRVYKNRIFVVVTHCEKLGALINVTRQTSVTDVKGDTYETSVLFGKDSEDIHAAARHIAEQLQIDRPLLLSLSSWSWSKSDLKLIISAIETFKTW